MSHNPPSTEGPETPRVAWWALGFAIVALLLGLVALLVAIGGDDDAAAPVDNGGVATTEAAPSTATATPSTIPTTTAITPATIPTTIPTTSPTTTPSTNTTTTPTTTLTPDVDSTVLPPTTTVAEISATIWPRPGSTTRYDDPVTAARTFAVEFVGFDPAIVGEFQAGDSRSGDVEVRSRPNGQPTVVHVRQVDGDDWAVIGASNGNITVSQPVVRAEIESPMLLAGSASAFEGTVEVQLYSDGSDEPIVEGFVTGSGGPEPGPFAEVFEWHAVTAEGATLLMFSTSPEDGSVVDAAALRLRFHALAV